MHSIIGYVSGRVQGVGFRYFVKRHAQALAVNGYAKNLADGRVEFLLQGEKLAILELLENIRNGPSYSEVAGVTAEELTGDKVREGFRTL